ncbi:histone-lysine N-methyltransferase, H3 lysine-79 specific-like [Monomorium pharaonis]|uniref:histone-lysine N-methyltransferase, H3 lysine-79 specific-like n=1 Tax=Monomorium pharaonis TaxID=307658 RepID=UPI0017472F9C|nr:histone-lysine N-methyltransferase, H3 lysine-79 specific-like [Monomorium pharaonis]
MARTGEEEKKEGRKGRGGRTGARRTGDRKREEEKRRRGERVRREVRRKEAARMEGERRKDRQEEMARRRERAQGEQRRKTEMGIGILGVKWGSEIEAWKRVEREMEKRMRERAEKEGWERMKGAERERRIREVRRRNIIWKGVEGEGAIERKAIIEGIMKRELEKEVEIGIVTERVEKKGMMVVITEVVREENRDWLLEKRAEIKSRWEVRLDEDLSMEERKIRWRMLDRANEERNKGKKVYVGNRSMWVDGVEWVWNKGKEWERKKGEGTERRKRVEEEEKGGE